MLRTLNRNSSFLCGGLGRTFIKRLFLSNAFKCTEEWENRLKCPAFKKVDYYSLYHQLDQNFQNKKSISVLDVDLFVNGLTDLNLKNELEDVLLKLRLNPECILLPDRATHAVIRFYLNHGSKEDLLNILADRLNYGVFPDHYLTCLLINGFIEAKDSVSAVKIAALQMLQEDFENPVVKVLSLYSCYNYLASSDAWLIEKEPEPDEEEEVEKVRVKYLRNPYYDDHFDMKDPNHLVGKTMWKLGLTTGGPLGASTQLIGYILHEKFDKCLTYLESLIKNKGQIHAEAVAMSKEFILNKPKQKMEADKPQDGDNSGEKAVDLDKSKTKLLKSLDQIYKKSLISGDLLSECEKLVKEAVEKHEKKVIQLQCEVYKQWEKDREDDIRDEIEKNQLEKLKLEIKMTKEELEKEEQKLFFFEKEEEYQLIAQQKEKIKESLVFYKPKAKEKTMKEYMSDDVSHQN